MKKTLFISALVLCIPVVAVAQGFVALTSIPGLTEGGAANSDNLAEFFNNLYKYLIGLAAVLAVIEIIWGGLEYSTQDSVSKKSDGKNRIIQAIFGLVLVLSPVLVFSIINPNILNLSLNLPKLDTAPTSQSQGTVATPTTTGSGNPCGSVNVGGNANGNCTTTTFTEGFYSSPPKDAWCYQMVTPYQGKSYSCFSNATGCDASRRTSFNTASAQVGCVDSTCSTSAACVVGI